MKIFIEDYCIRCGLCEDLYSEVFRFNYKDDCINILFDEIPEDLKEIVKLAIKDCAVTAIKIKN